MDQAQPQPQTPAPRVGAPPDEAEVAWIHVLAGEWQSRWQRLQYPLQYPQALSGASLRK